MIFVAVLAAVSIFASGCEGSNTEAAKATEYFSDKASEAASLAEEYANQAASTIVVDESRLFEPIIDEIKSGTGASSDAASSDASAQAAKEASDAAAAAEASYRQHLQDLYDKINPVNIVFFGDSQLANGRDDHSDIASLIGNRVPKANIYNMAIGGTTATLEKSNTNPDPSTMTSNCFLGMVYAFAGTSDREAALAGYPGVLETMNSINPKDVDYYFLSYGTNDFLNCASLDTSMYDNDQTRGLYNAMCKGIDVLREISPKAKIILITPFYGIYVDGDGTYIGDSYIVSNGIGTLSQYAQKVQNVSEDKETLMFDGMFMTKCDLYLDTADQYLSDHLHLSLTGRQIMARLLAHYVNFLEGNEPYCYLDTDFIKIAEFNPEEDYRYDELQMKEYYPESWEKYIKGKYPLAQPSEQAVELFG